MLAAALRGRCGVLALAGQGRMASVSRRGDEDVAEALVCAEAGVPVQVRMVA